jgi:hypothetical protein
VRCIRHPARRAYRTDNTEPASAIATRTAWRPRCIRGISASLAATETWIRGDENENATEKMSSVALSIFAPTETFFRCFFPVVASLKSNGLCGFYLCPERTFLDFFSCFLILLSFAKVDFCCWLVDWLVG